MSSTSRISGGSQPSVVGAQDGPTTISLDLLFDSQSLVPKKGGNGKFADIPVGPMENVRRELDLDGDGKKEQIVSAEAIDRNGDGETDAIRYELANGNTVTKEGVDLDGDGNLDGVRLSVVDAETGRTHTTFDADLTGNGKIDLSASRTEEADGSSRSSVWLNGEHGVGGKGAELTQAASGRVTTLATREELDTDRNGAVDTVRRTYKRDSVSAEQTMRDVDEDGRPDMMEGSTTSGGTTRRYTGVDLDGDGKFSSKGELRPRVSREDDQGRAQRGRSLRAGESTEPSSSAESSVQTPGKTDSRSGTAPPRPHGGPKEELRAIANGAKGRTLTDEGKARHRHAMERWAADPGGTQGYRERVNAEIRAIADNAKGRALTPEEQAKLSDLMSKQANAPQDRTESAIGKIK